MQASELPVAQCSFDEWRQQLTERVDTAPPGITSLLTDVLMPGANGDQTEDAIPDPLRTRYDCRNTTEGLAHTDVVCPPANDELLSRYLAYLRQVGFIDAAVAQQQSVEAGTSGGIHG